MKKLAMVKIYSVAIGVVLVLLGVWYSFFVRDRMEAHLPSIRNNPIFDFAVIYSLSPYSLLILSVLLFCCARRIAFWLLLASMVLPFVSMFLLAVAWTLFFPVSDSLFKHVFAVVFIGGAPFISILSLILLFPIFSKYKNASRIPG